MFSSSSPASEEFVSHSATRSNRMEDTLDSIVLILGMILIRHAIPKSQKSLGRHIFMRRSQGNQDVRAVLLCQRICRKPGSGAPQLPISGDRTGCPFQVVHYQKSK